MWRKGRSSTKCIRLRGFFLDDHRSSWMGVDSEARFHCHDKTVEEAVIQNLTPAGWRSNLVSKSKNYGHLASAEHDLVRVSVA